MKIRVLLILSLFLNQLHAQNVKIDSLKKILLTSKDTSRVNILNQLSAEYLFSPPVEAAKGRVIAKQYNGEALELSRQIGFARGSAYALWNTALILDNSPEINKGIVLNAYEKALPFLKQSGSKMDMMLCMQGVAENCHTIGQLENAINYFDSIVHFAASIKDTSWLIYSIGMKGHCYFDNGNYRLAFQLGDEAYKLAEKTNQKEIKVYALDHLVNLFLGAGLPKIAIDYLHKIIVLYPGALKVDHEPLPWQVTWGLSRGGEAYIKLNQLDSAILISKILIEDSTDGDNELFYGHVYTVLDQTEKALDCYRKGLKVEKQQSHAIGIARHANEVGRTYLQLKDFSSAIYYAELARTTAEKIHALLELKNAVGTLTDIYTQTKNYEKVFHFSQLYKALGDSIASDEYRQTLSLIQIQNELESQRQQGQLLGKDNELKKQQLNKESMLRKVFIVGALALLIFVIVVIRNNYQKRKANKVLHQQKEEIQRALSELELAQAQLIQKEKMASLGELTAGIAHEIQNPLNFVNNFSDINKELIDELGQEADKGNLEGIKSIAKDIRDNEQKINHHGKRADSIVKGMLQHSRTNSGTRELTDINLLAEEYLRLTYNGMRAKDKSINVTLHTDFGEGIQKINILPQEIGRVFLNLFSNAFYSVTEKNKQAGDNYVPTVSLETKKQNRNVIITISDNGLGIPKEITEKIFQPFFTTKPTGQGTGLGLSISYDIIKSHGGQISVESKPNEGAEFEIMLPG